MASDKTDTNYNGWTGQYFRTDFLNNNALVATLEGYPYKVAGTNPASTADAARAVLGASGAPPDTGGGSSVLNPFGGIVDWLNAKGHAIAVGGTGIFVGLAFLIIGLLILVVGTDTGRQAVKAAAAA